MANDLRLQVLLSAIDKATGPLKQITGGSKETARALKAARDRLKELNTQQRDVSAWRELQAATRATSDALGANNTKIGELSRITAKVRQQLAPTQALFEKSRHKVDALKTSQHELKLELTGARNALGLLGDEHRKAGKQVAALNAVMQKGNTLTHEQHAEYTRLTAAQRERKTQLDQLAAKEKTLADRFTLNNAQLRTSRAGHAGLREEIRRLETPFKAQLAQLKQHSAESKRLGEQYGQQKGKLASLSAQLKSAGINTNALGASELKLKRDMDSATRAMKTQMDRLDALKRKQESLAKVRGAYDQGKQFAGSAAVAGGSSLGVAYAASRPVIGVVRDYVDFESAMLGVAKQVDGARDDNGKLTSTYYEFADAIKAASNEMPIATTEFAALVEAQARAGIQGKENLLTMAKVSATAAVAFDLPAGQVGEDMGRIAGLYKVPIKNIAELGDALNYLDDNTRSKGGDIIETLTRMSDVADKLDYRKAAALGSTFLSLGSAPEVAASASRAMVRELAIATMQGKKFQEGMAMVGLDSKAVQTGMTKDAMGTIMGVLERIKKLSPEQRTEASTRLFGKEFGKDASKLVNNLEELRQQLKLVDDAGATGSMQKEMDVRANAIEGRWQVLQNKLFNTKSGAGESVRATMVDVMDALGNGLDKVNGWVKANPVLTASLLKIVASVVILSAVFGGLALTIAGILGPFLFLRFGLAMLGIRLPGIIGIFKVFGTVLRTLGGILIGPVVTALRTVSIALWGLAANPVVLAIAAVVAVLAGAAYLIYRNWDAVKAYFTDAWAEITAGFQGGFGGILKTLTNFSPLGLIYQAFTGVLSYLGIKLPSRVTDLGRAIINGLINGISAGYESIKTALAPVVHALSSGATLLYQSWDAVKNYFSRSWAEIKTDFSGGVGGILKALMNFSPLGLIYQAFSGVLSYLGIKLPSRFTEFGRMIINGLINGISSGYESIKTALAPVAQALSSGANLLYQGWDAVKDYFSRSWAEIKTDFSGGVGGILKALMNFSPLGLIYQAFAGVLSYLGVDLPSRFTEFGGMIVNGLVNGLKAGLGAVKSAIGSIGDSSIGWFKEKLGIHSPSRVFAQLGGFTMAGLAQGLEGGEKGPLKALTQISENLTAAGGVTLSVPAAPVLPAGVEDARKHTQQLPRLSLEPVARAAKPTLPINDGLLNLIDLGKQIATAGALAVGAFSLPALAVDDRPPIASAPVQVVHDSHDVYQINIPATPGIDAQTIARAVRTELARIESEKKARNRSKLSDLD